MDKTVRRWQARRTPVVQSRLSRAQQTSRKICGNSAESGILESTVRFGKANGSEKRKRENVKKASSKAKVAHKGPGNSKASIAAKGLGANSAATSTRDRIVRSATHLFATQGFANTSMPAIAKRSGITPGAIYRHFESKAELLMDVVRYALDTLPTSVRLLEPARIEAAELPEFAASYTSPQYKLIRQLSLEIHLAASREQNVRKLLDTVNQDVTQAIYRSIAGAQDSGLFNSTLNPDFTARFLLVTIMGLSHMETLEPHLIGDSAWHDFVLERISAVLGFQPRPDAKTNSNHLLASAGSEPD
jgi:AcrR family transcriptional regulator